jgi:YVTN family beta-propeller protein
LRAAGPLVPTAAETVAPDVSLDAARDRWSPDRLTTRGLAMESSGLESSGQESSLDSLDRADAPEGIHSANSPDGSLLAFMPMVWLNADRAALKPPLKVQPPASPTRGPDEPTITPTRRPDEPSRTPTRGAEEPTRTPTRGSEEPSRTPTRRPEEPTARPTEPRPTEPRPTELPPTPTSSLPREAAGYRPYKSGPIQTSLDGRWVWVANASADSVSRIDARDGSVRHFRLPAMAFAGKPLRHEPAGLSVLNDGSEVWVAAQGSDRVFVLNGETGAVKATIELPYGSGPYGIALSPPIANGRQVWALVTLHRAAALAAIRTEGRQAQILEPVWRSPLGIAWTDTPGEAWITHLHPDGEHPRLSRVDTRPESGPKVTTQLRIGAASPRNGSQLTADQEYRNVPEGGYLNFRGHPALEPPGTVRERRRVWLPTQYHNFHNDRPSPDSVIQASLRRLDLGRRSLPADDKIVLSAKQVHDPLRGDNNPPWLGYGWNASVSGLVDVGFLTRGDDVFVAAVAEQSDEIVMLRADTPMFKSERDADAPGLPELEVGARPMGIAMDPAGARAWVYNALGFDVAEIDLSQPLAPSIQRRIGLESPLASDPLADADALKGARLFFSSKDPRVSSNEKVSCASCHINGEHDGREWNFEQLPAGTAGQGHGPRAVPSMRGLGLSFQAGQRDAQYGFGQIHRSGDRDEVQDFEHTIRSPLMGGRGFLGDRAQAELGPPNAGRDADLDAIAHFLVGLPALQRSPHREQDGKLTESAQRGAPMFMGADPEGHKADADCASCHVPESAFLDFGFHDVGQRRANSEQELNDPVRRSACRWCVNTASLVGVFDTSPWNGVYGWGGTMTEVLEDFASYGTFERPAPHGSATELLDLQLRDLADFVLSLDGQTQAAEVRAARDSLPPRIVRAAATSHRRIEIWFNEAVAESVAASADNIRLVHIASGHAQAIQRIAYDADFPDRVTLFVDLEKECMPQEYRIEPAAGIRDLADRSSGGRANEMAYAEAGNRPTIVLRPEMSISLGASGQENLIIPIHDAGPVGPGLSTWSHDSPWLFVDGGNNVPGFVRFDWQAAFREATGVEADDFIRKASFAIEPELGDAQPVEIRRVLQRWSDPAAIGDWNSNPVGGPTWRDHSHPDGRWNEPGARRLGTAGDQTSHYGGEYDLAETVDALVTMPAINQPVRFEGERVTAAFRFWLEHPEQDNGYALRLRTELPYSPAAKFQGWEPDQHRHGPVLWLTYLTPGTQSCPNPD